MPKWLQTHYDDKCEQLWIEMKKNMSGRLSCYDAGQFTDTAPPPIFACASNNIQLSPSAFHQPTYFVWLPDLFHRIPCPSCEPLNKERKYSLP
jgi:hypothetical protein